MIMKLKLIVGNKKAISKVVSLRAKSSRGELPNCTLLISEELYDRFRKRWQGERALARCLNELLTIYGTGLEKGDKLNPGSFMLLYQRKRYDSGSGWNRINFRPDGNDWTRLGNLSRWHGVSRCFLFSYLLEIHLKRKAVSKALASASGKKSA
ncbi:hypothetical protein LEP1GSC058_3662 [Leptospira fainei serovar Hurstbridge str. BUT 6]|uniref:PF07600 family protein n=2 Tax=Leptospira fainei TaxID=48782 RepID=S3URY5_9LEPT|nr:hypothetical protein LEP1GSC058_3662 [Leptospira fainei serovar Hurstbridge str. BUT 6]